MCLFANFLFLMVITVEKLSCRYQYQDFAQKLLGECNLDTHDLKSHQPHMNVEATSIRIDRAKFYYSRNYNYPNQKP